MPKPKTESKPIRPMKLMNKEHWTKTTNANTKEKRQYIHWTDSERKTIDAEYVCVCVLCCICCYSFFFFTRKLWNKRLVAVTPAICSSTFMLLLFTLSLFLTHLYSFILEFFIIFATNIAFCILHFILLNVHMHTSLCIMWVCVSFF